MNWGLRRRWVAAFGLLTIFAGGAVLSHKFRGPLEEARLAAMSSVRPVLQAFTVVRVGSLAFVAGLSKSWHASEQVTELEAENVELRNRIAGLEAELADRDRQVAGLTGFRQHLAQERIEGLPFIMARVVGESPIGPPTSVVIDVGEADGVSAGCGVVWREAVVGVVTRTASRCSRVTLVTAPDCRIPAALTRTGENGLTHGQGGAAGTFQLTRIQRQPPQAGDIVITSGLLGMFPRNFVLGRIVEAPVRRDGLFYAITVRPAVDLTALHSVLVLRLQNEELRRLLSP